MQLKKHGGYREINNIILCYLFFVHYLHFYADFSLFTDTINFIALTCIIYVMKD